MHKDTIHSVKEITVLSCRPKYPNKSEMRNKRKNKTIDQIRLRLRTVSDSGLFACGIGANRIIGMAAMKSPHRISALLSIKTVACKSNKKECTHQWCQYGIVNVFLHDIRHIHCAVQQKSRCIRL